MDSKVRKEWEKPQLIILVRGRPEEAVLTACKSSGAGPGTDFAACTDIVVPPNCEKCHMLDPS
jgi:hypothetical protein